MAKMDQVDLQSLARLGAATRVAELEREIAALKRMFPGLSVLSVEGVVERDPHTAAAAGVAKKVARKGAKKGAKNKAKKQAPRGRQTPMTEAEKKAVSDRMKSYWAGRRMEEKAKAERKARAEHKAKGEQKAEVEKKAEG